MSPMEELQKLVFDLLKADAATMALVNGVYDRVPAGAFATPKEAYISFGPHDVTEDDAECIVGGEHTFQIDCWSRKVGAVNCKAIVGAVKARLHGAIAELATNALVEMRVIQHRTFDDPDGLTTHGIVMVTALIDEPA
jgi:hypothetical protein